MTNKAREDQQVTHDEGESARRPGRTILFGCMTIVVAFALLEFGLRMLALGAAAYESVAVANPQNKFVDHPFLTIAVKPDYAEVVPDYPTGGDLIFETNSMGYRGPEFSAEKPASVNRVVVVGGSAVVTGRTNDDLFTKVLEQKLNTAFEDVTFEVINAGVPGYTSRQELFLIETQVLDWEPDLVLIYDGRNDMFEGSMPDYTPDWTQRDLEVIDFLAGQDDPLRKHLFAWDLLARRVFRVEQHPERDYASPGGANHSYDAHLEALDTYERNLESAVVILKGYGIQPALAFQPTLLSTNKPLSPEERAIMEGLDAGFVDAHKDLLAAAPQRMGEVAERRDTPWIDLSGLFDAESDQMFVDDVHQIDAGNELIAESLFQMLEPVISNHQE